LRVFGILAIRRKQTNALSFFVSNNVEMSSFEILVDEFRPVVKEKVEFENRVKSKLGGFF